MPQDTQDTTIPKLVTDVTTDHQLVDGPDGKQYRFGKNISQARIDKYFTKQGWQKKGDKWFTASGESVDDLRSGNNQVPTLRSAGGGIPGSYRIGMSKPNKGAPAVTDFGSAAAPSIFAGVGSMFAGTMGAAAGGAIGEATREVAKRFDFATITERDPSLKQAFFNMGTEAVKQAALDKVGQKAGDYFFNTLAKYIPKAIIKKGIPLLPGDLSPNSKVAKYVEDLLTNLAPSAKTMEAFRTKQGAAISTQAEKLANGFAKFNGTSEEMGVLLQNTLRSQKTQALKDLELIRKSLPKGRQNMGNALKDPVFRKAYDEFNQTFEYELMRHIVKTNKPELIAGFIRTSSASLGETRLLTDFVHEVNPEILGKVQNRIMRDVFQEAITGSKDPTLKGVVSKAFSGVKFKQLLDGIGEQKLKALYGEQGFKNVTRFEELIAHVDKTQGSGVGRFLNLMFLLPFRGGMSGKALGKTAGMGIIFNRAAKVITSTEGIKLYENVIKTTTQNTPRLAEIARRELVTYNERSDREYEEEQRQAEEEFKKEQIKAKGDN